jgi:hypothetical protein
MRFYDGNVWLAMNACAAGLAKTRSNWEKTAIAAKITL